MDEIDNTSMAVHEQFMRRCIELARVARSRGNTPVGSIVVLSGKIVGEGMESLPAGDDITGHAEILACQASVTNTGSKDLRHAALYSTAEPCFMCSYAIRQCDVSLVVFGVETPQIGGVTGEFPVLTAALSKLGPPPRIVGGVLEEECRGLWSR